MLFSLLLIWLVLVLTSACLAFVLARAKGLQPLAWVVVALSAGPLGLVACAGMPDRQLRARLRLRARELEALHETVARIERALPQGSAGVGSELAQPSADQATLISQEIFITPCPASEQAVWSGLALALGDRFEAADPAESDVSFYEAHVRRSDGSLIAWFRVQRRSGEQLEWHREH